MRVRQCWYRHQKDKGFDLVVKRPVNILCWPAKKNEGKTNVERGPIVGKID